MNTVTITQVNKYFKVDIGDQRIHMLNQKSLVHHLKQWGFNPTQRASIVHMFEYEHTVTVQLPDPKTKAA